MVKEDLDEQKGAVSADDSKGKLWASDFILYFSHSTDRTYDEEQIVSWVYIINGTSVGVELYVELVNHIELFSSWITQQN